MIPAEKQMVRAKVRRLLRGLSRDARLAASAVIARRVREEIAGCRGGLVLGFASMADEPGWWSGPVEGVSFAFPVVDGERLRFRVAASLEELEPGPLGAPEPVTGELVDPNQADLVLVPGLAFDRGGNRLGRGGGYYDRLLSNLNRPRRVGVAFAVQILESLPVEPHDARVDDVLFA